MKHTRINLVVYMCHYNISILSSGVYYSLVLYMTRADTAKYAGFNPSINPETFFI